MNDEEDDEDFEEQVVREQDSCLVVGHSADGDSSIRVYLFDEGTNNLYVHHEFVVPSFPLCVSWLSAHPRPHANDSGETVTSGSFAAVGTFLPGIEIWNCDVMNPIEPTVVLGGVDEDAGASASSAAAAAGAVGEDEEAGGSQFVGKSKAAKKKLKRKEKERAKKQPKPLRAGSHTEAVMCLGWRDAVAHELASGSADKTVKLWDVTTQQCVLTAHRHADKVQAMEWNPVEVPVLLTGAYDKTVSVMDIRAPTEGAAVRVSADVETVRWNPHAPYNYLVATEDGRVVSRDLRMGDRPEAVLFSLQAHKKAASALSFNALAPTVFATASLDGSVKLWDTADAGADGVPKVLAQRDLGVGALFSMTFDRSSPFVLAAGGSLGCLAVWDTMENLAVNERYGRAAEQHGLGSQALPEEYIALQRAGGQGKGIGPGPEIGKRGKGKGKGKDKDGSDADSDSEDEDDEDRAAFYGAAASAAGGSAMGYDEEEEEGGA